MPGQLTVPNRSSPFVRLVLGLLLAAYFVSGLAYLVLRHYLWPRLDDWRPQVVAQLTAQVGRPVELGRIDAGFEGLRPRLTIESLRIDDDDGTPALAVPRATAVLSLASLVTGEFRMEVLQLESPKVRIERLDAQRLRIAGIDLAQDGARDDSGLQRLLAQRRILVHAAAVEWIDRESGRGVAIEGIELVLGTVGRRHRGALTTTAGGPGWERAYVAFEIYRAANSSPADWKHWSGQAYVGLEGFDALQFGGLLPAPIPLAAGRGDLKAWVTLDDGRLRDARLKLAADGLDWRFAEEGVQLALLQADLAATRSPRGHTVKVQQFQAQTGALRLAGLGEQEIVIGEDGRARDGRFSLAPFDAQAALAFARELPLAPGVLERLARLSVSGDVRALSATWSNEAGLEYEAAIDFERLSLRYREAGDTVAPARPGRPGEVRVPGPTESASAMPWFENLSGEARITRGAGELRVRAERAVLGFPAVFAEPAIPLQSLRAEASWTIEERGEEPEVAVEVRELRFANEDAAGVVKGSYRTGGKGPGIVDLQGSLERADASRAARYLPLQIEAPVREWARSAILAGRSGDARFRVRGDLYDFPYRDPREGDFSVTARVEDGVLRYAPDWPQIERFQGTLAFERAGMRIQMRSGQVFGVALGSTQATIRDFEESLLRVEGSGEGPAADMLRFVNESPVATRIDDFTRDAQAQGSAKLSLSLKLPLGDLERSEVAGAVQFLGNHLRLDNTIPPFGAVSGTLEFNDRGLALRGISGTFLDGPLKVEGETPEPGRFLLRGEGRVSAQGMRAVVDNPLTQALAGEAGYRALIDVRRRASTVTIESDLAGLASLLPAPLAKAANEVSRLKVSATPELPRDPLARPQRDEIRVTLGEGIQLLLQRERDPKTERLLIRRGSLALNADPALRETGLSLVLNTPSVDIDAWTPILRGASMLEAGERAATEFGEGFSLMPSLVSVVTGEVRIGGKVLHDVVFGASRLGGFWNANVDSREVSGFFNWRDPGPGQRIGTLGARFTRLEIPRSRVEEIESLLDTAPSELPALDVSAEEFVLFEHRLGRLELRASNGAMGSRAGWRLDALRITNPAADFKATGSWAPGATAGVRPTRLEFELTLADAGGLLGIYELDNVVRGGAGRIAGDLHWIGSPMAIDYPSLGGEFRLEIGKGQFLKADPGIAKLIGVLNLQALPRRLALDFKDVFAEGFAFDEITGDVTITHGIARTSNLQMRGVQAQVRISGEADIERETQSLAIAVRPDLGAGIAPLAYGALINPVVGLGAFVAQLALRGQIEQFLTYEYDVQGTWDDPQVVEKRRYFETPTTPMP